MLGILIGVEGLLWYGCTLAWTKLDPSELPESDQIERHKTLWKMTVWPFVLVFAVASAVLIWTWFSRLHFLSTYSRAILGIESLLHMFLGAMVLSVRRTKDQLLLEVAKEWQTVKAKGPAEQTPGAYSGKAADGFTGNAQE
jgi:hypothetical protein